MCKIGTKRNKKKIKSIKHSLDITAFLKKKMPPRESCTASFITLKS